MGGIVATETVASFRAARSSAGDVVAGDPVDHRHLGTDKKHDRATAQPRDLLEGHRFAEGGGHQLGGAAAVGPVLE
ncbi:MAG: hypothetical protein WBM50_23825, partial [Acidimicrobiales bacterium]